MAATNGDIRWPPRSPHEARMSTPGGRNRLRQLADRTSPSPSPTKRSQTTSILHKRSPASAHVTEDDDDDEDEETLQLRLQEIQARLRLKKLQKAKGKASISDGEDDHGRSSVVTSRTDSSVTSRVEARRQERLQQSSKQPELHVPVSPVRKSQVPVEQRSPGRVLLGIDKGLKASDISLRRAPNLRKAAEEREDMSRRLGGYLRRPDQPTIIASPLDRSHSVFEDVKPKTFSERMADIRTSEADRRERDKRIQMARSRAFDIDEQEIESLKRAAASVPEIKHQEPEFSRDQIVSAFNKPAANITQRNRSIAGHSSQHVTTRSSKATAASSDPQSQALNEGRNTTLSSAATSNAKEEASTFEMFSSVHLSKRIIPHNILARTFDGKKIFTLPELLKQVKAPEFSLPDIEEDIVLIAIIASKSAPRQHAAKNNSTTPGKYMVLKLTDLTWEVDLFLFNTGFEKFWKLGVGTTIAILNPSIMPPMQKDTGRFSVTINSSDDTVLEIGTARDLGFCKSVKKDGKVCNSWVDKRHSEFCEFHTNEAIRKTKASRMEVNSMNFGGGMKRHRSQRGNVDREKELVEEKAQGIQRIRGIGKIQVVPGKSTSTMLADEYVDPDAFHFGSKEERMRKRNAEAERERDIAEKLGQIGAGQGANYMRVQQNIQADYAQSGPDGPPTPPDAKELGLLGGRATEMHLSPIKRKRNMGMGSQSSNTSARGWGGALSKDLGRMREGESLQKPVKKKTRIMTDKGIREPGRESFGGEAVAPAKPADDDDDDDDLDIVH